MFAKLKKNPYFINVVEFLERKNLSNDSYLVGGTVRDLLLDRELKDLDFAINGKSIELAKDFAKTIDGTFVLLDETFSIGRVVKDDITIDFSELRGSTIESDLAERDFTINAIAVNLQLDKLIDPFGGHEDLKKRLIRMVNEQNLRIDPLRILRAYRFHSTLGFNIEENTREALKNNVHLLKITAKERVKDELWKTLLSEDSHKTIKLMVEDEIFKALFKTSEILPLNPNLNALQTLEEILKQLNNLFKIPKYPNPGNLACLKFTALFGYNAPHLIRQIKPSKKEERFVEKLIEAGDRIKKIETLLDKVRFVRDHESILYFALIYGMSTDPLGKARTWFYRDIEEFYRKVYLRNKKKLPLINGEDILSLGFSPSPLIGEILERIQTLVLAGKISKKEEAFEEIKKRYSSTQ